MTVMAATTRCPRLPLEACPTTSEATPTPSADADVCLMVEGQELPCHSQLLALHCTTFAPT